MGFGKSLDTYINRHVLVVFTGGAATLRARLEGVTLVGILLNVLESDQAQFHPWHVVDAILFDEEDRDE